jgi:site-specific DNA recombinase
MRRVAAYCRSANETDGSPSAVEAQEQVLRRYAEHRGLTLTSIYTDAGVSGVTLERPELQQLIADCRAGEVGTVITRDADRLSRDLGQRIALLHIFDMADVRVEYSTDPARRSDALLFAMLSAVAELENATRRGPTR